MVNLYSLNVQLVLGYSWTLYSPLQCSLAELSLLPQCDKTLGGCPSVARWAKVLHSCALYLQFSVGLYRNARKEIGRCRDAEM